jgi:SecD/SecF fusion protein
MSDRRRNLFVLLVVLGLLAASLAVVLPGVPPKQDTKLGLDLQGGVQLVYEARPTKQQPTVTNDGLQRSLDIMRERVDQFGVAEPELLRTGSNQIEVDLPGVADAERAARQVGTTAQLYFYDWEPNVLDENCRTNPEQVNGGQTAITGLYNAVLRASKCKPQIDRNNTTSGPIFYAFDKTSHRPLNDGIPDERRNDLVSDLRKQNKLNSAQILSVPEGIVVVRNEDQRPTDQQTSKVDQWWVLRDNPVLSGTDIKNPEQNFDQQGGGEPIVTMEFTSKGRKAFAATTRAIAQRGADNAALNGGLADPIGASHHFAIRLDNELISTPYINFRENPDGIDGSSGAQISGGFTIQSAQDLARLLKIGALPLRLELISRSQVSATLGKQALHQGLVAGLAGFAIVAIFLIVFYRVLGVIATLALGVYALYLFALIKLIPITLTLPGIAGLILTIGVAADANIVIFERVKEEVRAGRSISAGIAQGYKKGFSTIVDANVVTLLVAFILFILATAGVKGFAFVLGVGTLVSLFTAVLATQAILLTMRNSRALRRPSALGAGKPRRPITFDFMGASKWFFSASGLILLVCGLAIGANGLNFGIDFESGTRITAALDRPATVDQVRDAIGPVGFGDAEVQTVQNPDLGRNVVQISAETSGRTPQVTQALDRRFGLADSPNVQEIGPTFGQTVANSALIAIIASLSVISIYIALRFEWKYAVPVLIALMHDILITAGVYSLVGREVTTSTVAALLTILGFSLYDTIIVFDRIRENVPRMPSAAFSQIVNRSMSEVIVRSLATSFCTVLPVLALFLFGGETLRDFAFALIVGTLSGAYSSVFIAGPVLTHWKEREPVYRARTRRIREALGEVPAYAVATAGGPVDVDPARRSRRTTPVSHDPAQGVSRQEFDDMVANLGLESESQDAPRQAAAAGAAGRPAGGRRARARNGGGGGAGGGPGAGPGAGAGPGGAAPDGGESGDGPARSSDADAARKKSRNRRHGRPR